MSEYTTEAQMVGIPEPFDPNTLQRFPLSEEQRKKLREIQFNREAAERVFRASMEIYQDKEATALEDTRDLWESIYAQHGIDPTKTYNLMTNPDGTAFVMECEPSKSRDQAYDIGRKWQKARIDGWRTGIRQAATEAQGVGVGERASKVICEPTVYRNNPIEKAAWWDGFYSAIVVAGKQEESCDTSEPENKKSDPKPDRPWNRELVAEGLGYQQREQPLPDNGPVEQVEMPQPMAAVAPATQGRALSARPEIQRGRD